MLTLEDLIAQVQALGITPTKLNSHILADRIVPPCAISYYDERLFEKVLTATMEEYAVYNAAMMYQTHDWLDMVVTRAALHQWNAAKHEVLKGV